MPWSVYLLALPWQSAVRVARRQRPLTDVEWRLLLWVAVPLLFFTISIGKQPRYILPVLPPLAILLARSMTTRIADAQPRTGRLPRRRGAPPRSMQRSPSCCTAPGRCSSAPIRS